MMTAAHKMVPVSVAEYLAAERTAPEKHEYLGGYVYAMAGGKVAHNRIATNILVSLGTSLRGQPCQPYNSDMKVRVQVSPHTRFYYPDASVVCDSNPPDDSFQDRPVVIVEVLSSETRRIDETEKRDAYCSIPSLLVYLLVEQDTAQATVYRRNETGFVSEFYSGLDAVVPLPEIGASIGLIDAYAGLRLTGDTPGQSAY